MHDINNILQLALSKVSSRTVRAGIEPGRYTGRALLECEYDLTVGEDYLQAVNVPWQKLACIAFSKLNETTQNAIVREAAENGANIGELVKAVTPGVKAKVRSLMPDKECKGKVTGDVRVVDAGSVRISHNEQQRATK